jgi:transposase-like protein
MARNQVQFQKGLSEAGFAEIYGTEEQCHATLVKWRWPNGFECPGCNGADHCVVTRGARRLFQCNACRKQTSVKAGTIFASSKLPLRIWFKTIYLVTQSKKGISSIELGRRLGVTQTAAWMMKHKLAQVMLERNASKRLKGNVQMDDAYVGGARSGRRGRGAAGKTPFVAAIATTDDGKPDQIILRPVRAFSSFAIRMLASTALEPGANIVSDGLACFTAVTQAGCIHTSIKTGSGKQAARTPAFNGQYRIGQHQSRPRGDLPRRTRKTRPSISRGVRISIQSPISSRNHDPPPRVRCAEDRPQALPLAQTG